ncbi:MAG: hypothetical protein ACRC8S_22415 [Fimbriiglobus sp.]
MFRRVFLSLAALMAFAGASQAQLPFGIRPGIYYSNPRTGQQVGLMYYSGATFGAAYTNPVTGVPGYAVVGYSYAGPFNPVALRAASLGAYQYAGSQLMGGVTGIAAVPNDPAKNPIVQEQLRLLRAAGGQRGGNDIEARKLIADQRIREANQKNPFERPDPNAPVVTDADVISGQALNALAKEIRTLHAKGTKADSQLLAGELIGHVQFDSTPASEIVNFLRLGKNPWPSALNVPEWTSVRMSVDRALLPVLDSALASKKITVEQGTLLMTEINKAKTQTEPLVHELSLEQAGEMIRFWEQAEQLAKLSTQEKLQGVFNPTWTTLGATVSEFTRHMEKYGMGFGPAPKNDEDAYFALYQAMSSYHKALQVKK